MSARVRMLCERLFAILVKWQHFRQCVQTMFVMYMLLNIVSRNLYYIKYHDYIYCRIAL